MARVFGGISVMTTKLGHVSLATQYRCNDNLMERNALNLKTVKERMTYVLQKFGSSRYKVRNAAVQLVNMIKRIAADIHKFRLALLSVGTIDNSFYAMLVGSKKLYVILVRKGITKMRNAINAVLHQQTILVEEA